MSTQEKTFCFKHTDRETGLTCAACGKPICVDCVVQTPVGGKCKECARGAKNLLTRVAPHHYAIGLAIGLVMGTIGGLVGGQHLFISFFAGTAIGSIVGEAIRKAVGRRYGLGLAIVAGIGIIGGLIIAAMIPYGRHAGIAPALFSLLINPAAWVYVFFALPAAWWRLR